MSTKHGDEDMEITSASSTEMVVDAVIEETRTNPSQIATNTTTSTTRESKIMQRLYDSIRKLTAENDQFQVDLDNSKRENYTLVTNLKAAEAELNTSRMAAMEKEYKLGQRYNKLLQESLQREEEYKKREGRYNKLAQESLERVEEYKKLFLGSLQREEDYKKLLYGGLQREEELGKVGQEYIALAEVNKKLGQENSKLVRENFTLLEQTKELKDIIGEWRGLVAQMKKQEKKPVGEDSVHEAQKQPAAPAASASSSNLKRAADEHGGETAESRPLAKMQKVSDLGGSVGDARTKHDNAGHHLHEEVDLSGPSATSTAGAENKPKENKWNKHSEEKARVNQELLAADETSQKIIAAGRDQVVKLFGEQFEERLFPSESDSCFHPSTTKKLGYIWTTDKATKVLALLNQKNNLLNMREEKKKTILKCLLAGDISVKLYGAKEAIAVVAETKVGRQ